MIEGRTFRMNSNVYYYGIKGAIGQDLETPEPYKKMCCPHSTSYRCQSSNPPDPCKPVFLRCGSASIAAKTCHFEDLCDF
jgi:hypothetical protein